MDKFAIKVVLNPVTTPRLYGQLSGIVDPRLRAEIFRRLAEIGAEAVTSSGGRLILPPPSIAALSAFGNLGDAQVALRDRGSALPMAPAQPTDEAPLQLSLPVENDAARTDRVGPPQADFSLDVDAINSAMSRFFAS
ncbi:hypothetical protein [Cupriavidus numazuensis]|uniref:Uncharacterized protein n=1 Tax=Cupriavidus numazuensis TaxID=221992 RepID=A0ABN7Q8R3_9BURK|nr:hypothetical protein [Cupriavidus numazuensis]CAG2159717.1 hypothetical protein LMG26411_06921 [Cupriavidus numazuensis]